MDIALTTLVECIARVQAAYELSRNGEGNMVSAGEAVAHLWPDYITTALGRSPHDLGAPRLNGRSRRCRSVGAHGAGCSGRMSEHLSKRVCVARLLAMAFRLPWQPPSRFAFMPTRGTGGKEKASSQSEYYARRAQQERAMAQNAKDTPARWSNLTLAEQYERIANDELIRTGIVQRG